MNTDTIVVLTDVAVRRFLGRSKTEHPSITLAGPTAEAKEAVSASSRKPEAAVKTYG